MIATLRPGDFVIVRGNFGESFPHVAKVDRIVLATADSTPIASIAWSDVHGRGVIVDLADRHWAYGFQLSQLSQ